MKNLQVVDTADGEVSLAWEEPESDGGSKVIGYVVERRDVKRKTWTLATDHAESPEYTVTGLQKDSMYLFRVCARNRVGSGPNVETDKPVQAKNKFGKNDFIDIFKVNDWVDMDTITYVTVYILFSTTKCIFGVN